MSDKVKMTKEQRVETALFGAGLHGIGHGITAFATFVGSPILGAVVGIAFHAMGSALTAEAISGERNKLDLPSEGGHSDVFL